MADKNVWIIVLIIGAILLANSAGVINIGGLFAAKTGPAAATVTAEGTLCLNDGAVMTVGPAEYRYSPTTSVSNLYHRVFVDGINRGLKADGSTMDVTTPKRVGGTDGAAVEIYYAENATGFYAAKHAFSVPCVSAFATAARPDSDAYQIVANQTTTTMTISVFNDDDGLLNQETNNESITANDAANLDIKVNYGGKRGFSPYGKIGITVKYNGTAFDEVELSSGDTTVTKGTVPTFRSNLNSSVGYTLETWEVPGIQSLTTIVQHYNLYVESSSLDPVATNNEKISVFFDDQDYFLNTDTGKEEIGYEDNDNTQVGTTAEFSTGIRVE